MEITTNNDFKFLPKGELHLHLFGAITSQVVLDLIKVGSNKDIQMLSIEDLRVPLDCKSLPQYLTPWKFLRLVPEKKEALQIITDNVFSCLAVENIKFVELRNTIVNIARLNSIEVKTAMLWMLECIEKSSKNYNIHAGLILTIQRGPTAFNDLKNLLVGYKELGCPSSIVGFDIAGNESLAIDPRIATELATAKEKFDLGITIHAGEIGNTEKIIEAVNQFHADRIGHGTAALLQKDVLKILQKKNICLEICPISNLLTGAIADKNLHYFENLIEHEIPFVICSDNPGIQNTTLSDDYKKAAKIFGEKYITDTMFTTQEKYTFLKEVAC